MEPLKPRDKVTQHMTRDGLTLDNQTTGESVNVSSREAEQEYTAQPEGAAEKILERADELHDRHKAKKAAKDAGETVAQATGPVSRLQFTAEERASPELAPYIKKAEKRADQLEAAKEALPKKRVVTKETVYDEAKGKAKSRLYFDKVEKSPPQLKPNPASRPIQEAGLYLHGKIHEVEHENVGVEGGHKGEELAERQAGRMIRSGVHRHKLKPYRAAAKAERKSIAANAEFAYQKSLRDNPELAQATKNPVSRFWQKQHIKREYAKAARAAGQTAQGAASTAKTTAAAAKKAAEKSRQAASFAARHWKGALIVGGVGLMLLLVMGGLQSCTAMFGSTGTGLAATSYLSEDSDMLGAEASLETIRATAHELITTIDGHLAQLQKERQAQQEQPQAAPLEQAAEQTDPDSVFSKLPPEQQQEMTASVKAMLQTLIDADLKSTGEVSQGTKEAAQAQGFTIAGDGTLEQAKAPQEAAYRLESGEYLYIQTSETGYDYTLYGPDYKELDGGQLDNPDLSLAEAGKEILAIHERPAGTIEPLTGDGLDDFLEATEQANAIPQPQAWNGIDGLLNGKPFMPEASPADRAAALIELAEKNAPRLGSEERQLIVAYAEAVGDNDKVIGLINRLCEQGYELQKGQMDSFVKSEIESEIAVANAKRQIAQNPAAEPVVTILWSESPHLKDGQQMPLHEAEAVFKELDSARRHEREQPGYTGHWYDKTKFRIDFTMQGQPDSYEGRQDFGDGDGSLIQHIRGYHEYYAQDESWKNHVLHHEGPEAWEADKAQRDMLLHEFVPYMELHCNLATMEQEARRPLRSGETLTPEQTAYFNAVLDYVKECRPLLNQGQYHLPEPPQLADFDQSLQDYKKQIEAELEQEAATAGLTVEEYVASDYEAPAQPNFSIYQVPPGPEGRDFRYRSYEELQADGLSVDRKNYQLIYSAPLDKDITLDEIYRRFNMEHPADYKGHSLSMGDIVVFRQDGKQTAYYVDEGADYRQVPEFFAQPEKQLTPDECMTGEQIQTPRGRFYLTDRSREQMEAAGYGFHHQSEDGRYLIMANGTRAFAIPAQPESHIKTAEMSTEQNYNMIDGMMNNAPSMEELEARAKAGEQISLLDVAEATKAEAKKPKQTQKTTQKQKKPSIRAQLAAAKEEQKKKPPAREKSKEMEV